MSKSPARARPRNGVPPSFLRLSGDSLQLVIEEIGPEEETAEVLAMQWQIGAP
jgi:hypothetical protein